MTKNILPRLSFFLILTISFLNINAQQHLIAEQPLNDQQQSIVLISAMTATGNIDRLKVQLNTGLDARLTVNQIKELLVQLYAYCGFPRSLNAINAFKEVLEERSTKGINDEMGKEIVVTSTADKYEQGRKVLEVLTKTQQPKPAPGLGQFVPRIDTFLKEHLFADVFASNVLSYFERELITISALASMTGVEPQLQAHLAIGKNMGLSTATLLQVSVLIGLHIGRAQENLMRKLLGESLLPVTQPDMMVRISEIEIYPEHIKAYNDILKKEASASVSNEPGVIAIFPMYQQQATSQVRIVEIYANKAAYQSHLKTPHFLHYKTATLKMVKSLKLVDMESLDRETMLQIFQKLK